MNRINLTDYTYHLPDDRIALFPLEQRDQSKLLVYNKGMIKHHVFHELPGVLPQNTLLFFNNTKVIPARLHFQKETGSDIEIFLLSPVAPSSLITDVMGSTTTCSWQCTIGNLKRWKNTLILHKKINETELQAELTNREEGIVTFTWDSGHTFAHLLSEAGETPLPPYLHRKAQTTDRERYQTVYSQHDGAVAAPTAGLHFTEALLHSIKEKKIDMEFLTLHVSAGTFQPVKTTYAEEHVMHSEQVSVNRRVIQKLLGESNFIVAVGTTSMRTLESLYWYGVRLLKDSRAEFSITQEEPYTQTAQLPTMHEAVAAAAAYMDNHNLSEIRGSTSIYILPGYRFRVCQGLITNFHQPGSTLLLLIAAFVGNDWKRIYDEALKQGYRFLSYGDSSLLIPTER